MKVRKFSSMWLIYWREKRGYTQKELAEMIGVQYQAIQRYERIGESVPSADRLMEISTALEIDINELFDH